MVKQSFSIFLALALLASPVFAEDKDSKKQGECTDKAYYVAMGVNVLGKSYQDAKKRFDDRVQAIRDTASKNDIGMMLLSWNYGINPQQVNFESGPEQGFTLNANGNYQLESQEGAFKLAELLLKQKINATVNVSENRNGRCPVAFH